MKKINTIDTISTICLVSGQILLAFKLPLLAYPIAICGALLGIIVYYEKSLKGSVIKMTFLIAAYLTGIINNIK